MMSFHTKKILNKKVTFVQMGNVAGFFFRYKGKTFGNYTDLAGMDTFDKDYFWQVLNENAKETIRKLKQARFKKRLKK